MPDDPTVQAAKDIAVGLNTFVTHGVLSTEQAINVAIAATPIGGSRERVAILETLDWRAQ